MLLCCEIPPEDMELIDNYIHKNYKKFKNRSVFLRDLSLSYVKNISIDEYQKQKNMSK